MNQEERSVLEEELIYLKNILDFYVKFSSRVLSMDAPQIEAHIDDILDRLNEIENRLKS
ncbi:hypothetical protein [Dyadobacter crusticola]|uniref:hypothetical protein n=1 Tax=Dyadobacter crusticola TaxID=292407 RepID=UPI000AF4B0FD|nr:hypothetical protein [Dyadobacter crusticola]